MSANGNGKLDQVVAKAHQEREKRTKGYREQSLKIHPWICGRCSREFDRSNLHELTVHHKDHNHDNNPTDGRNWENLCIYCHDNEHTRQLDHLDPGVLSRDCHGFRAIAGPPAVASLAVTR